MSQISYDQWLARRCGLPEGFSQAQLDAWQLAALRQRALYAFAHSRFYRELYAGIDLPRAAPGELPLISGEDIARAGTAMACLSQTSIQRIVTMETSGSTGLPKRIYFSAADLELTVDFFAQGMTYMVSPGDKVLICMPGHNPDGLNDLLSRGLRRINVEPCYYGLVSDLADAATTIRAYRPDCIVAIPGQMLALAESAPDLRPPRLLLSADNVPDELRRRIEDLWHTEVFAHWGMRETGLGGAVECGEHQGYHIRHADLLLEIVDPLSGRALPDGQRGELVISTFNREAMPLLRYRTGDIAHLIAAPCGCGSGLKRLGPVQGHKLMEVIR
ncbi:MAG: phenylacetate--CoA ligase family protein [Clostridia bacterium]|nr:phenylacetate--CoA ligase family protein [Clostridia bacterium]